MSAPQGRFLSPDPDNAGASLTDPQSWNAYSYVRNNPLNLIDPSGMGDQTPIFSSTTTLCKWWQFWCWANGPGFESGGTDNGDDYDSWLFPSASNAEAQPLPSAQPTNNVAKAGQALAPLQSKINSLTKPCSATLPSRARLRAKANQISFWDARIDGSVPVSSLPGSIPSVPGATVGSEVSNAYAVTLYGPNHSISSNVVLGSAFFKQGYSAQQTTLLHEDLHYVLQKNDQQVVQKFNILLTPFDNFSSAFNRWLTNNCH